MKRTMKRFLAILLCFAMVVPLLPAGAFAVPPNWDEINIQVDVFDLSASKVYENVGQDIAEVTDDGLYQSAWYQIPPLSKFTDKSFGRVHKVVGNWAPTSYGSCNVGANVQFSENNPNARIIYYVGYYDQGDDSGESGGGGDGDGDETIDGGNNYSWKETIVYHSNFPDGTDYQYTVNYTIHSYTQIRNEFTILKKYADCGFTAPALYTLKDNPYWNTKPDGSGQNYSGGGMFTFEMKNNGKTTHLYAQYDSIVEQKIVHLTYMNGDTEYAFGEYDPQTDVPVIYESPTEPNTPMTPADKTVTLANGEEVTLTFQGWADNKGATEADYHVGDTIHLGNDDKIVYAVWKEQSEPTPEPPTVTGKVGVTDTTGRHEAVQYDLTALNTTRAAGDYYTVGQVTPEGDSYSCTVTINAEKFAERYSTEKNSTHHLASDQGKSVDIKYTYDKDSGTWSNGVSGDVLTDIKVECDTITINPADITIYMGGDGYSGVVDGAGQDGQSNNGLPTPGYFITMPQWVNDKYFTGIDQAHDLTKGEYTLHFVIDGQENERAWDLERYSANGEGTMGDDGVQRFLYRLEPAAGDKDVRMQFIDSDGVAQDSDDFQPNPDKLFSTYTMKLYSDKLDLSNVKVQVVNSTGDMQEEFPLTAETGTLTVRGTHKDGAVSAGVGNTPDVVKDNTAVTDDTTGSTITAIDENADTKYHINGSQVDVSRDQVSLLADEVFDEDGTLDTYLADKGYKTEDATVSYQYLDLVQPTNGNAQIVADQPMTIYWKAPKNADLEKDFTLVHFSGLDRDYTGDAAIDDKETIVYSTNAEAVSGAQPMEKVEIDGATYLKFSTASFSPFALIWTEKDNGGGGGTRYRLHYESNGGTEYNDEWYNPNTTVQLDKTPTREGYTFTGWYADKDLTDKIDQIKMTSNKTVYAGWKETDVPDWLNGRDHLSYIAGYEDGTVRPQRDITRAEVASIFYRLLEDEVRDQYTTTESKFTDVDPDSWYGTAVATMANAGIIKGRTETSFAPDAPITRAEFAAIASRFDNSDITVGSDFTDISGHWAENAIERAATLGWIMGYEDGTFRPENQITRAEAMAMINRVLKRLPEADSDLLAEMKTWPDNQPGTWYYLVVQEATNSHDFERKDDGVHEKWTNLRDDTDIV